jgi:hypothetical protein
MQPRRKPRLHRGRLRALQQDLRLQQPVQVVLGAHREGYRAVPQLPQPGSVRRLLGLATPQRELDSVLPQRQLLQAALDSALRRVVLRWAVLRWAVLQWAVLRWAVLRWAVLQWAVLRWAVLQWAVASCSVSSEAAAAPSPESPYWLCCFVRFMCFWTHAEGLAVARQCPAWWPGFYLLLFSP